jgi:hypothetical protein
MAKKIFLCDVDLALNQLLQAKLENLASDPTGTESRLYYNTVIKKIKYYNGTTWLTVIDDTDGRLTDARTPSSHVIATNLALGAQHTISGAAVGHVLRASGATTANFQQLAHADLANVGTTSHADLDTHVGDATKHRIINDAGTSNTELFSASRILQLIADVNTAITGSLIFKGGYDASTNTPLLDATPIAVTQGWTYVVTVAGTFFTEDVQIGDMLIAKQTTPTTLAHWTIVNKNIPDIVAATETAAGIIEIATAAEVGVGTDNTRALTPAGTASITKLGTVVTGDVTAVVSSATEILAGKIEIATQAEVTTGTDDTRAITPLKLKTALGTTATVSNAKKYSVNLATSATSYIITHGLATSDVIVSVRDTVTPFHEVEVEVTIPNTTTVVLGFNVAPTAAKYTVTIVG